MKRILIFSTAYLPLIGGAELAIKEITDRLKEYEFDLICARIKKELPVREKIGNINVHRVGKGRGKFDKIFFPWFGFRLSQRFYRQKNYDLVWAVMASFGGLAALFFRGQFNGVPYVLTLQEGDTLKHIRARAWWLGPLYQRMFKKTDLITAISQYLKNYAKGQGADEQKIEVVPNGVDLKKFSIFNFSAQGGPASGGQFSIKDLRKKLGIKENEKVIITVSRLVEKNGVGDLIEAVNRLATGDYRLPTKLLILGEGPLEKDLKLKVKNEKLEDKILFLGNIANNQVPKYLALSDLFARPSLAEGLGNSFLEAMACGVPIIGTRVGGIPDFLKDRETGLFCEVKNPADLAEKIIFLLNNDSLRRKIAGNARRLIEEKYQWEIISRKMGDIFSKLIGG